MLTFSLHLSRGLPYNQLSPCVSPCLLSFLTSSFSFFLFPHPPGERKSKTSSLYLSPSLLLHTLFSSLLFPPSLLPCQSYGDPRVWSTGWVTIRRHSSRRNLTQPAALALESSRFHLRTWPSNSTFVNSNGDPSSLSARCLPDPRTFDDSDPPVPAPAG